MTKPHKILIVDDHELVVSGITLAVSRNPHYEIAEVLECGMNVVSCARQTSADIVILDINLPDISGLDVLVELVNVLGVTVLILTGENRVRDFQFALKMGAHAIVSKSDSTESIIEGMDLAMQGKTYVSPKVVALMNEAPGSIDDISLSPRQMAILHYLAAGETNKEIGYRLGISAPTVSFHLRELRTKLGVRGNKKILNRAYELELISH